MMLKIKENPSVQAYAYHAYLSSIIEGCIEAQADGLIMKIKVLNDSQHSWINHSKIIQNDAYFAIDQQSVESDMYEYVYRECDVNDELIVRVDILQNKLRDSILNFAITGEDFVHSIEENEKSYKCGYLFNNRLLTRVNQSFVVNNAVNQAKYCYVKLCRHAEMVSSYISVDGEKWELVEEQKLFGIDETCKIGFIAEKLGKVDLRDQYEAWLCSNFIQIKFDPNDIGTVFLDYSNFPIKNGRYERVHGSNFVEISYEEPQEIIELCGDMVTYIDWCLEHEYYIAVSLDEYCIEGRSRFGKEHYHHHNLIYGYDEARDGYEIMGYDQKLLRGFISKEQIKNSMKKFQGVVMRYKFLMNETPYKMDLRCLYGQLVNFKLGNAAMNPYASILTEGGCYGKDACEQLIQSETGRVFLIGDKRVSFLLFERSMLMKRRLLYLFSHNYLSTNEELLKEADFLTNQTRQIMNLVVKNNIKPMYAKQILEMYVEWYTHEMKFIDNLISYIESEREKNQQ